jgi:hypothetical protein
MRRMTFQEITWTFGSVDMSFIEVRELATACACDCLSYIRILTHHEGVLILQLCPELVGADASHSILGEAQVGGLTTLQAVERVAQHLLCHLDSLCERGGSVFVGVAKGQGQLAVLAADDGQG